MAKVTGFGGIFFKARDPAALGEWYARHLGFPLEDWGGARFEDDASRPGYIVWTPFAADTTYFAPSSQPYMLNFRVDDLDGLLAQLKADGVDVDGRIEESEFGRFSWIMDPEGTRIELWQPPG
ncbi:VOC family protein [Dyella kyungheensis]|jgi:predicted enzyme related to lactoylglutathione lyase|uniref:VOC family protein n=1 Tax=Dyella kyungheensis TaxID=1242174 RepID=A0ABS2JWS9_9GAMM|nr:VOC family protein [Dyella kyungheensis]MBM7122513.1 VOC family protein [Dyella kyungheensis]